MERTTGNLGDILLREGLITNSQLEEASKKHNNTGESIGKILIDMGAISESDKLNILKKRFNCEVISLSDAEIPPTILTYIPKVFATKHHVVPVRIDRDGLVVAMEDPTDIVTIDNLKTLVGIRIKPVAAATYEINENIGKMPEIAEPVLYLKKQHSALFRAIRYSAFPILCFLPIPLFILFVNKINFLFNFLTKSEKFDIFLYTLIGWGFWAIILYEINGLIFGESSPKPKPQDKDENFK